LVNVNKIGTKMQEEILFTHQSLIFKVAIQFPS
jgi:hypothetical protein